MMRACPKVLLLIKFLSIVVEMRREFLLFTVESAAQPTANDWRLVVLRSPYGGRQGDAHNGQSEGLLR